MTQNQKTALVVGASRGLGLGLVQAYLDRGWHVIATVRGPSTGLSTLADTAEGRLAIETLDITDEIAVAALREKPGAKPLDLLFVSAGIGDRRPIAEVSTDEFTRLMVTNALAPMRIVEAFADRVTPDGVVAAMSSVLGSVGANTNGGYDAYRASKAALNTLLRSFAARHADRSVVALHPGWVRTDMGGSGADIGVEESVAGMVAALASRAGRAGCVFLDYRGTVIAW